MTDKARLNKLQRLTTGYGKGWILRYSIKGHGLRLHETSRNGAVKNIREAIDKFLIANDMRLDGK